MRHIGRVLASEFLAFMLVQATPDCRARSLTEFREAVEKEFAPILARHDVSLRYFDLRLCSNRITDIWIWSARDAAAYHLLMADLSANRHGNRSHRVRETLVGVEDAHARKYYRELLCIPADPVPETRTEIRNVA